MKTAPEILNEVARLLGEALALNASITQIPPDAVPAAALGVKLLVAKMEALGWVLATAPEAGAVG